MKDVAGNSTPERTRVTLLHITGTSRLSEVMDADAFHAFEEAGDVFDAKLARRLHDHIYSAGGSHDAAAAYIAFRGRLPATQALLEKRGLVAGAAA